MRQRLRSFMQGLSVDWSRPVIRRLTSCPSGRPSKMPIHLMKWCISHRWRLIGRCWRRFWRMCRKHKTHYLAKQTAQMLNLGGFAWSCDGRRGILQNWVNHPSKAMRMLRYLSLQSWVMWLNQPIYRIDFTKRYKSRFDWPKNIPMKYNRLSNI